VLSIGKLASGQADYYLNLAAARVDRGASAVPSVLAALEAAGAPVASITVARPSLDDVYLIQTGRTFAAAEEGDNR